jgi:hypothetical protein
MKARIAGGVVNTGDWMFVSSVESRISRQGKNRNNLTLDEQMAAPAHKREMPCVLSLTNRPSSWKKKFVVAGGRCTTSLLPYPKCLVKYTCLKQVK